MPATECASRRPRQIADGIKVPDQAASSGFPGDNANDGRNTNTTSCRLRYRRRMTPPCLRRPAINKSAEVSRDFSPDFLTDFSATASQPLRLRASHDPLGQREIVKSVAERRERGEPRRGCFRHASGSAQASARLYFSLEFAFFCLGQYCCPNC